MNTTNQSTDPLSSISLLRDGLLPNLLKEDEKDILYWAGKELARSHRFNSLDELIAQTGRNFCCELNQVKSTKHTVLFTLTGELVEYRLKNQKSPSFSLETGFLSEGHQQLTGVYTEGTYETNPKKSSVSILLQSDHHVSLNE